MSFICPLCGSSSEHPEDERERYCGHCHVFLDDVCGAVEPNHSRANAAVCTLARGHDGAHAGLARGPAAAERPGRHTWLMLTDEDLQRLSSGTGLRLGGR